MTKYERGSVVLLPFPFTDQTGSKRRPAVILSNSTYNARRADIIVAPITSNVDGRQPDDSNVADWAVAGLKKPSVVKGILGTVQQSLVIRVLGAVSPVDLHQIQKTFAFALDL